MQRSFGPAAATVVSLALLVGCSAPLGPSFRGAVEIEGGRFDEPSGIVHHPLRDTLFVAGDSGSVLEMTSDGRALNERDLGDLDFEGITVDPSTGLLYLVEEGRDVIHELDPETLALRRWFEPARTLDGRRVIVRNDAGLEGITFVPDAAHPEGGTFVVLNQNSKPDVDIDDPSALIELDVPLRSGVSGDVAPIRRVITPGVRDLAGIHYDARGDEFYVVSDKGDEMLRMTRDGEVIGRWSIGGDKQEGLTIDAAGRAFLAQDAGGVLLDRGRWPVAAPTEDAP